ncbi:MAG TPA: YbaB/EbfC family nucleoid-associated protein [Acidimicrobiales bacterium]|nr:YbaB/EbfC family nucleoid-associated protein [Acidimicrobiales bacterium]
MTTDGPTPDMGALFAQIGQMSEQLKAAQEEATTTVVEGVAGGGAVRVTATGALEVTAVHIDPSVVDPADVEMLQDLVLAAVRDVIDQAQALQEDALGGLGGLGGGLGGLGEGGLGGLLGP